MNWADHARTAAAVVMGQFGDATLGYRSPKLPSAMPAREWACVLGTESFQPVVDPVTGATSIKITRTADVPTSVVLAAGITAFEKNAIFTADGHEWTLDEAESRWDDAFVTFGLAREPLVSKNEMRRASV